MDDPKSSRKRKRIVDLSVDLTGTKFGQLRRVLLELRPHVLEVLKSPDIQNSRGAPVIIQGTRQIKELCKELRDETMSLAKQKKTSDPSTASATKEEPGTKNHADVDLDHIISVDDPGPPLIGCSPTGWNFIVVRNLPGKAA